MSESANHEGGLPVAVVSLLALLAVAAMLVSGWRFVSLYSQLGAARQAQSEADAAGSRTVVDRLSLPVNRPLQICNHGAEGKVTALAAFYWTAEGAVAQFNSAQEGWFNWPLPAGKTVSLAAFADDRLADPHALDRGGALEGLVLGLLHGLVTHSVTRPDRPAWT